MPDAGDFERNNASGSPASWGDALAALPLEAPDAGGWQRLQTRLPAATSPRVRRRWPVWLAAAASLGLVVALPLRMLPDDPSRHSRDGLARHSREGGNPWTLQSKSKDSSKSRLKVKATATSIAPVANPTSMGSRLRGNDEQGQTIASRDANRRASRITPSQRPIRTAAEPADATRVATSAPLPTDLEPFYARSAQLESLLAMARDDRVASGTSAALSDALDARVVAIDATLSQAGISDSQRADLWDQRVDALQQLVGIETTNRLYAARGQRYDAALVSID